MNPTTVALAIGTTLSLGMGERPGVEGHFTLRSKAIEIQALASDSNKYTGRGWIFRPQVDVHVGCAYAGAAYSWRNGGDWEKQVLWLRGGLEFWVWNSERSRLLIGPEIESATHSKNQELRGAIVFKFDWKNLRIEGKTAITSHIQGTGVSQSIYTGVLF